MAVATAKRILSPGTRIAGYCIEAEIGHGAMAVVYRARQLNLDRPVALKILSDELAANHEFVSRFFNEARAAAALSHAHIVQAYDAGIADGGIHFFAMEYVEGETLLQRIRNQGHIRPGPGIELAIDIADALNYGWLRQGLTHGDIKPENIMINRAGESKLADFGLAKVAGHDFTGSDILLTPLYAAPEKIRGEQGTRDCRSDIYAFGATLYHLFGGSPPFPGEKAQEVMQRHLTEALEPLRQRNPAVPGRISDLVGVLLRKDPAQRPADWEAVLASLHETRKALTEPPAAKIVATTAKGVKLHAARPRAAQPRQRRVGRWIVLAVLLLLVGVAGVLIARRRTALMPPRTDDSSATAAGGEATPTVVAAPVTPPSPAGRSAAELWSEVRQLALAEGDPDRVLGLLEDFGSQHPGEELPAAYTAMLAESRAAAKERQAAAVPATAVPATADALGAAGLPAAEGAAAAAEGMGQTLPTGGEPVADTVLAEPPVPAAVPVALSPEPSSPVDLRADALVTYMGKLAELEDRFPLHVETCMQDGQEWLRTFADDSTERAVVLFVVNTVLPALEEALPKLAANSKTLVGLKMPGREFSNCTVAAVDVKEITLREQTQYGAVERKVPWQTLDNRTTRLLHLSGKVAARGATWADRRPHLALILLTRNAKLFDDAVKGLPAAPEKADWERLRTLLARATAESKALRTWQRALEARREGERTAAYRLLLELQATRSAVAERYGDRARGLVAEVSAAVPEVAGGALLRESKAQVGTDAQAALAKVLLAGNRYGAADFPELAGLERLRDQALAGLPLEGWQVQQVCRQPQHVIVPFARPAAPGLPALAIRMCLAAGKATGDLVPGQADMLATLQGPSLLELGDWAAAERLLSKLSDRAIAALPPPARAATWFSRGLTESRFGVVAEDPITEALGQCSRELTDRADSEFVLLPQILALEYGLFLRGGGTGLQPYLVGTAPLSPRGPGRALRARLVLDLAALSLDRGQAEVAAQLVPTVLASAGTAAEWGLTEAERALLLLAVARPKDAKALTAALGALDSRGSPEHDLRLVASMALAWDCVDEGVWRHANEWISEQSLTYGPLGGTAVYDLTLARIGRCLATGDLQSANDTAAWALALTSPCLTPYYARLVFTRWGVARLQGRGGNRELAEQVDAATCANRQEKALARLFRAEAQREKAKDAVRDHAEGRFWLDWLTAIDRLADANSKEGRKGLERLASSRLPRAEQALLKGLAEWAARAPSPNPGQNRNQPIIP